MASSIRAGLAFSWAAREEAVWVPPPVSTVNTSRAVSPTRREGIGVPEGDWRSAISELARNLKDGNAYADGDDELHQHAG